MPAHIPVRICCDRINMRRELVDVPRAIGLNDLVGVDGEHAVGVDRDHHVADVGVDGLVLVAGLEVSHEGLFGHLVQEHKVMHSFLFLEFGVAQHLVDHKDEEEEYEREEG